MAKLDLLCFVALYEEENLSVKYVGDKIACRSEDHSFASSNEKGKEQCLWMDRQKNYGVMREFYPCGNLMNLYEIRDGNISGIYKNFSKGGDLIHSYIFDKGVLKIKFF